MASNRKQPARNPVWMKSRLGKRKCANVSPRHARDSQGRDGKTNKTGEYVAIGGKCTQGKNNSTVPTQGADGMKLDAT